MRKGDEITPDFDDTVSDLAGIGLIRQVFIKERGTEGLEKSAPPILREPFKGTVQRDGSGRNQAHSMDLY